MTACAKKKQMKIPQGQHTQIVSTHWDKVMTKYRKQLHCQHVEWKRGKAEGEKENERKIHRQVQLQQCWLTIVAARSKMKGEGRVCMGTLGRGWRGEGNCCDYLPVYTYYYNGELSYLLAAHALSGANSLAQEKHFHSNACVCVCAWLPKGCGEGKLEGGTLTAVVWTYLYCFAILFSYAMCVAASAFAALLHCV